MAEKNVLILNITVEKEKQLYDLLRPIAAYTIKSEQQAIREAMDNLCKILGIQFERI